MSDKSEKEKDFVWEDHIKEELTKFARSLHLPSRKQLFECAEKYKTDQNFSKTRWEKLINSEVTLNTSDISGLIDALKLYSESQKQPNKVSRPPEFFDTWGQNLNDIFDMKISKPASSISPRFEIDESQIKSIDDRVGEEDLFGRTNAISQLEIKLSPGGGAANSKFIIVYGPLGAGKSTIVKEAVYRLHKTKDKTGKYNHAIIGTFPTNDKATALYEAFITFLEDRFGIKTAFGDITEREKTIIRILEKLSILIVVDEVNDDITQPIIDLAHKITNRRVKIVIVQNTPPRTERSDKEKYEVIELIDPEDVLKFLEHYCKDRPRPSRDITIQDAKIIADRTRGNLLALRGVAGLINKSGLEEVIQNLHIYIANPGSRIAEQWIGAVFRQLEAPEKQILAALTLFRETAEYLILRNILIEKGIYASHQFEASDEPEKAIQSKAGVELEKAIYGLIDKRIISQPNPAEPRRYKINSAFYIYIRQILKDEEKLDGWRESWLKAYLRIPPTDGDYNLGAGWTIFLDYSKENDAITNLSHPDEIRTIRDLILYCTKVSDFSNRLEKEWEDAARLIDFFRAKLFGAGMWEDRLRTSNLVVEQARRNGAWHYVGQFERLIAWMHCFTDNYQDAWDSAERAYIVASEHIVKSENPRQRHIHSQTLYKTLIAKGLIALREGQSKTVQSKRPERKADSKELKLEANRLFDKARTYFKLAHSHALACYEREALIVEFYLAVALYYRRYSLGNDAREISKLLKEVERLFEKVLEEAITRKHIRLEANARYFLGKARRRLATKVKEQEEKNPQKYFEEAEKELKTALSLAIIYGDKVLQSQIEFALGQYYYSLSERSGSEESQKQTNLKSALQHISKANKEFASYKMILEGDDSRLFLTTRFAALGVDKSKTTPSSSPSN